MRKFKLGIWVFLCSFLLASNLYCADITDLEGTTGYIGKEDIKWGTGQSTDTFTVTTYDGGTATLTKVPDLDPADESTIKSVWFVAAMAGDHGNTALTGSLAWVIDTLSGDQATVILPGDQTYQISTDLTVPATVYLVIHRGAIFSVDAAKTLTINGDIMAGAYQIFSGAGNITLGANIIEHDQWRDGAGDDILPSADDAINLGASAQRFKTGYFEDADIADDVTVGDQVTTARISGHPFPGLIMRAKFTWKDADEIYIDAGVYYHNGTTEQLLYWDSQITYQFTSLAASDWSYLYFDDSAIVTAGTNLIAAGQLTDSITEPGVWSNIKHGRYNGEDLCFFAVRTDGAGNILKFYHDGGDVYYDAWILDWNDVSMLSAGWTTITVTIPSFSQRANMVSQHTTDAGGGTVGAIYGRVEGSSESSPMIIGTTLLTGTELINTPFVMPTDGNQQFTAYSSTSFIADTARFYTQGWYFPNGM